MKTIIACLDFSDVSDAVLRAAAGCAKAMDARLLLFHCVPVETPMVVADASMPGAVMTEAATVAGMENMGQHLRDAKLRLVEMERQLLGEGVDAARILRLGGSTAHVLAAIRRYQPDMIVMGSHGHGAFHHLLMGGTTQRVLQKAPCPVLVVPSQKTAATEQSAKDALVV